MREFGRLGPLLLAGALVSASCRDSTLPVEVHEVEVRGVPDTALLAGATVSPLLATPKDGSGRALDGRAVGWSSSDDAVARVDAVGMLTAVARGTAVIAAEVEGRRGTAQVTVVPRPALRLSAEEVGFAATAGEESPAERRVEIANAGGGTLDGLSAEVGYAEGQPEGWLRAELSGASAPAVLTLWARAEALPAGAYGATVLVRSPVAENAPQRVSVRLAVEPARTGPLRFRPVDGAVTTNDLLGVWGDGRRLVAVGAAGTILRSTDAGVTWSSVESGSTRRLGGVWGEGATVVAVGEGGTILRSADAGATWSAVESGTTALLRSIRGHGATLVAVGNGGTILRSTDAGVNWSSTTSGSADHRLAGVWGEGRTWFAVGDYFDAGAFWALAAVSADSGRSWSAVPKQQVGSLAAAWGTGSTVVLVAASGRHGPYEWIRRSTDGGETWSDVMKGTSGGGLWSGPNAVAGAGSTLVAVGNYGRVQHSVDGGASWSLVESGTGSALHGVWLVGGRDAIAVGAGGLILRGTP